MLGDHLAINSRQLAPSSAAPITLKTRIFIDHETSTTLEQRLEYDYVVLEGYRCVYPKQIVFASDGVSASARARQLCDQSPLLLGYSVATLRRSHATVEEIPTNEVHAMVFDSSSLLPIPENVATSIAGNIETTITTVVYMKNRKRQTQSISAGEHHKDESKSLPMPPSSSLPMLVPENSAPPSAAPPLNEESAVLCSGETSIRMSGNIAVQYVPLGGGQHGDSLAFDSTEFLWSFVDAIATISHVKAPSGATGVSQQQQQQQQHIWSQLKLSEINIFAGCDYCE